MAMLRDIKAQLCTKIGDTFRVLLPNDLFQDPCLPSTKKFRLCVHEITKFMKMCVYVKNINLIAQF